VLHKYLYYLLHRGKQRNLHREKLRHSKNWSYCRVLFIKKTR